MLTQATDLTSSQAEYMTVKFHFCSHSVVVFYLSSKFRDGRTRPSCHPAGADEAISVMQAKAVGQQLHAPSRAPVYPPEAKSLAEATGLSSWAGVKLHRQEALCLECKGLGDEAGGAVCEGPLRGTG